MKRSTFKDKKRKWRYATEVRAATYDWIRGRIQSGDTEEINQSFRKSLKLSEKATVDTDSTGYLYINEGDRVVAIYHPTHKEPELFVYKQEKRRVANKKWDFWSEFNIKPTPQRTEETDPTRENLFARLDKNILQYLFNFCNIREILDFRLVCTVWNNAICQTSLWTPRLQCLGISPPGGVSHPFMFMQTLLDYRSDTHLLTIARAWIANYRPELAELSLELISTTGIETLPGQVRKYDVRTFGTDPHWHVCTKAAGFFSSTFRDTPYYGAIAWINGGGNLKIVSEKQHQDEIYHVSKWLRRHMHEFCDSIYFKRK
jgi:hypothetical protein